MCAFFVVDLNSKPAHRKMASGSLEPFPNRLMSMASKPEARTSVTSMTLTLRGSCASVLLVLSDHAARSAYFEGFAFVAGASSGWTFLRQEKRPMLYARPRAPLVVGQPLFTVSKELGSRGSPKAYHWFADAARR